MDEHLCHDFDRVMEIKDCIDVYASSSLDCLPNDIIHQVLNFLSDRKEVAKASVLSKSWQGACFSHPILEFSGTCCFLHGRRRLWGKLFIKFVDNTMNRFDNGGTEIRKFKLDTQLVHIKVEKLTLLLDKWIAIALQKSQSLDLTVKVRHREFKQWTYQIPAAVLFSGSIQSLSIGFQVSLPSSFFSYPDDLITKLCTLRTLEIYQASNIGNKEFQRLLQVCPLIENLTVDSSFISEIKASGLVNLETIDITTYVCQDDAVKIEAPSVKTLCLHSTVHDSRTRDIHVDCRNLKYLNLKDAHKSSEWFHRFLSKFPLLETLELYECITLKWIKIDIPMIKKVALYECQNLSHIEIQSPKLLTFQYRVISLCTVPSITVDNPEVLHSEADFFFVGSYHLNPSWFFTVRELLQAASYRRSLSMKLNWIEEYVKEKELWPLDPSTCELEDLHMAITAPPSSHFVILSRLFSTFHPKTVHASLFSDKDQDFLKFLCLNLANREGRSGCCCFDELKCWKHQLKDVKIEAIRGMETGPLSWQMLFQMLPNLTVNHRVCFRLQWAT